MRLAGHVQVNFMLDGAQTLPTLGKHVPRVLSTPVAPEEELPATPKTAPAPFYPTTPSKSRPDKTPVTVAAFRKRRIQLVASAFQEYAACLPLSCCNFPMAQSLLSGAAEGS